MSYIDILVRLHSTDHRILMDRAAVKGRTITELAGEVLRAGIHSRAREAREAAWDEYRTTRRIGAAEADVVRAAFAAGWETAHGRAGTVPGRRPRNRAATTPIPHTPEPAGCGETAPPETSGSKPSARSWPGACCSWGKGPDGRCLSESSTRTC